MWFINNNYVFSLLIVSDEHMMYLAYAAIFLTRVFFCNLFKPYKKCWALLEKQWRTHKQCPFDMETLILADLQRLALIRSVREVVAILRIYQERWPIETDEKKERERERERERGGVQGN